MTKLKAIATNTNIFIKNNNKDANFSSAHNYHHYNYQITKFFFPNKLGSTKEKDSSFSTILTMLSDGQNSCPPETVERIWMGNKIEKTNWLMQPGGKSSTH